jgi:hypothetical protein
LKIAVLSNPANIFIVGFERCRYRCLIRNVDNLIRKADNPIRKAGNLIRKAGNPIRNADNLIRKADNPIRKAGNPIRKPVASSVAGVSDPLPPPAFRSCFVLSGSRVAAVGSPPQEGDNIFG